jgi:tetratricopeptide (TPR) repeat protein
MKLKNWKHRPKQCALDTSDFFLAPSAYRPLRRVKGEAKMMKRGNGIRCLVVLSLFIIASTTASWAQGEKPPSLSETRKAAAKEKEFSETEKQMKKAVETARGVGAKDLRLATALEELGNFYSLWGKIDKVEKPHREALEIREAVQGADHPDVVRATEELAAYLMGMRVQGFTSTSSYQSPYGQIQRSPVMIPERQTVTVSAGPTINTAAVVKMANCQKAEVLYQKALASRERVPGAEPASLLGTLSGLESALRCQNKREAADGVAARNSAINGKLPGPPDLDRANQLNQEANALARAGKYSEAEPLFREAMQTYQKAFGAEHVAVAKVAVSLGLLCSKQEKYAEAEPLFQRAIPVLQHAGNEQAVLVFALVKYADLLRKTNRMNEAEKLEAQAKAIRAGQN